MDNINVNQDNGWIVYVSDRRGDEPAISTNPNLKTPTTLYQATPNYALDPKSVIGDGQYNREDVIWTTGGQTGSGGPSASSIAVKKDTTNPPVYGCTNASPSVSDNQDAGKSPSDSNDDCFIETEDTSGQYSETAPYEKMFDADQLNTSLVYSQTINGSVTNHLGGMVGFTQIGTNATPSWSYKPPVVYRDNVANTTIEMFRRAVRLVNAANLFPTGAVPSTCGALYGITLATENPVYVFGNFNAPAGAGIDNADSYPGINGKPAGIGSPGSPTPTNKYNGDNLSTCGTNCHVPSSIICDALSLLSNANVGTTNVLWSGATGVNGWMDLRSYIQPYQADNYRTPRNTVYRFGLIGGFTPSWYSGFWGSASSNQGGSSPYSSGGLNNFLRFLEDWSNDPGSNDGVSFATYAGSLIRCYKSQQGNGAFKRTGAGTDTVYVPPNRDWIFDLDFSQPCTLPPGSPFLQLVDFKGFQQSSVQQR
jgi:hypothetical protein